MRVLVACEYSGTVRDAFLWAGHDAVSCDLLPTDKPGPHFQGPVEDILYEGWDLLIAHPPCTYLCNSGGRWLHTEPGRREKMLQAARFFLELLGAPIPKICIENPIMHCHARNTGISKYDQTIQPYEFGHPESKRTCLWLKNLPKLKPADVITGPIEQKVWKMSPSPDRWKKRSTTYFGIAEVMASQWG